MSYQLPQELQTKKLVSLPDDIRAHAEELIANKFGIAEVMTEGRYENRDRIQDPFGKRATVQMAHATISFNGLHASTQSLDNILRRTAWTKHGHGV